MREIRLILSAELNSQSRFTAINSLAVPVVRHNYKVLNWKLEEIRCLDRKTRKLLTANIIHHSKADMDKVNLLRKYEGRGLLRSDA